MGGDFKQAVYWQEGGCFMNEKIRILVFGGNGQLGKYIGLEKHNDIEVIAVGRSEADCTSSEDVYSCFEEYTPHIAVNCAAYTNVQGCETTPHHAFEVNCMGSSIIAKECNIRNIPLIYISTDYVYPGTSTLFPFSEDLPTRPLNVYGWSKYAGEMASMVSNAKTYVFRVGWLYSEYKSNFIYKLVSCGLEHGNVHIIDDEFGVPTYCGDLAKAIVEACRVILYNEPPTGIYHVCNSGGSVSRYEYGKKIINYIPGEHNITVKRVHGGDFIPPVKRPKRNHLSTYKFNTVFGITLPNWEHSVKYCVEECTKLIHKEEELS